MLPDVLGVDAPRRTLEDPYGSLEHSMDLDQRTIDGRLEFFKQLIEEDPSLRAEFESSRGEFSRAGPLETVPAARDLAARRHLEWFLLERPSAHLGSLPIATLVERCAERSSSLDPDEVRCFLGSHASLFEVTRVRSGEGLWLRDLAGQGEYPAHESEASRLLEPGDLIAGRIFPIRTSLHHISRAASFFRSPMLREALRNDLQRAREGRRGVLRLSQSEIERMFFSPMARSMSSDPVGEAGRFLLDAGVEPEDVEAILQELADEPYAAEIILPGAQDVLAAILDRLAFETAIDLDQARRILILAWAELAREGPGTGPLLRPGSVRESSTRRDPDTRDVVEIVAEFDRKRESGEPLERIFTELENKLALEDLPAENDEEDTPAPDFPGVVGAMIEEFLWETSFEHGGRQDSELARLRSFGRFAAGVGVFENLHANDILTYTCYWLPESDELPNADAARSLLGALQRFCSWAEEKHAVRLHTEFKGMLRSLQSTLPRVIEANRRRTRESDRAQGELFECLAIATDARSRLRDRQGREHEVEIDPLLATWLRPKDRVRGRRLGDGRMAVYCCYPPESEGLTGV